MRKENISKVSIVMPTAGRNLQSLKDAIVSALSQEYKNVEVVVVSDGKNSSKEVVDSINDKRITFIEAERWGDPVRIREIGIENSSGDYICFLDDDDILYSNHVSTLIENIAGNTVPFTRAKYIFKRPGKPDQETLNIEPNNPFAPYYKPEHIFDQNIAPISSFLIKKSMHFEIGGFDKNLVRLEDWDYWARMALKYELKFVDVITNEIRVDFGKESRTNRNDILKEANELIGMKLRERFEFMKMNKKNIIDEEVRKAVLIPKVSVIMPIYNAEKFLDEAIQSILNQTFKDFELLLINDGSIDGSKEIIEKYRIDKRVRIFHKKNEGVTKTLNFGLSKAIGRYIARMDADDISLPERLQLQVEFLESHRNVGLLGTRFIAITEDGKFIENLDVELTNKELQEKILKSCRFGHPTVMMTRAAIETVGGYDESSWANTVEDYDLWLRIAEKFEIANLPQYLLKYRINPNSITQTKRKINEMGTKECIRRAKERRGLNSDSFVSICIPAYKQPELLKKAVDSVLTQTHKNFEIVITDDSPDDSVEKVISGYNDERIRYIRNIDRKGTPENWNESMRNARGEYIKILHHDDWFPENNSLAKFVQMLDKNPSADFAFGGSLNFNPEGVLQFVHKAKEFQIKRLRKDPDFLFSGNFIGAPSATIFRKKFDLLFDNSFKWVVDYDFYIRFLKKNGNFEYTQESLIAIRMMDPNQVTATCENDKDIQLGEYLRLCKKVMGVSRLKSYQFGYLWYLFDKFKVRSLEDIKSCGYEDNNKIELNTILFFQQNKIMQLPFYLWGKLTGFGMFVLKILLVGIAYVVSRIKNKIT